jgi:hypothetical protein
MNSNEKGNIGLAKVIDKLVEMGYYCFLPFTDTTCVDLIIGNNEMQLKRIQVKHKKISNDLIKIRCASVINGKTTLIDKSKIDYFIVYCPNNKEIYYLPISIFENSYNVSLRVNDSKIKYKTMKHAKDFLNFDFTSRI